MTEEELKKEAEEYAEGMAKYYASTHEDCIPSQFEKYLRNAYISSAEPRDNRIEELEKEIAELRKNGVCVLCSKLAKLEREKKELEKENAELKNRNAELKGMYAHSAREAGTYKQFFEQKEKENAELKNKLEHRNCLDCSNHSSKLRMRTLELEKENAELKGEADSVLDNWCKGNDPCPHLKKRDEQLTKAKDIIKNYMIIVKGGNITVCSVPEENRCINVLKLNVQAEQFLKDSEVNK